MGAERTWSTADVAQLIAEVHDRDPIGYDLHIDAIMPWVDPPGSGNTLHHAHADVVAALIYSAIPHPGRGVARLAWHADTARAIAAYDPAGYAPWAVIDPTDGSWFTCSTEGMPIGIRQRTTGLLVHVVNLDRLRAVIGGRR